MARRSLVCPNCRTWFVGRGSQPSCPSCKTRLPSSTEPRFISPEASRPVSGVRSTPIGSKTFHCPYCFWQYELAADSLHCPACGRNRFDGRKQEGFVSNVPTVIEALSKALAPLTYSQDGRWPNRQAERMPTEQMVILGVFILVLIVGILPSFSGFGALFVLLMVAAGMYWIWKHAWTEVRKQGSAEPPPTSNTDETDEHDETTPTFP